MTGDALKRECQYEVVIYQVKRMLRVGFITEYEFQESKHGSGRNTSRSPEVILYRLTCYVRAEE